MTILFYVAGAVSLVSVAMVITRTNAVHALLYLIVSLLALGVVFYSLGAPFVAALEVIIYAGAIIVLFVFAVMMLNLGAIAGPQQRQWRHPRSWLGPSVLAAILALELIWTAVAGSVPGAAAVQVTPKQVGIALFGPYLLGVELASFLLLAALVGAYHLGRRGLPETHPGDDR